MTFAVDWVLNLKNQDPVLFNWFMLTFDMLIFHSTMNCLVKVLQSSYIRTKTCPGLHTQKLYLFLTVSTDWSSLWRTTTQAGNRMWSSWIWGKTKQWEGTAAGSQIPNTKGWRRWQEWLFSTNIWAKFTHRATTAATISFKRRVCWSNRAQTAAGTSFPRNCAERPTASVSGTVWTQQWWQKYWQRHRPDRDLSERERNTDSIIAGPFDIGWCSEEHRRENRHTKELFTCDSWRSMPDWWPGAIPSVRSQPALHSERKGRYAQRGDRPAR